MTKKTILEKIENLLLYKNTGEDQLYTFCGDLRIKPSTFYRLRNNDDIHFFIDNPSEINSYLYEICIGNGKKVIVATYSYYMTADRLSNKKLRLIYNEMKGSCK